VTVDLRWEEREEGSINIEQSMAFGVGFNTSDTTIPA
jgi:hypothetical protein